MPLSLNKAKKWLDAHAVQIVIAGMGVYVLAFAVLCLWRYGAFEYGLGLAYHNQIFWRTLNGAYFSHSFTPYLSLAYHVEPIIPALVPFYALFPDPRTLLVLQTIALALPALPILLIARRRLGALSAVFLRTALPLVFAFAWLANPFVHAMNLNEFHLLPFAIAPLFFALLAYERRKRAAFVLLLGAALLVQESVAPVAVAFGVLAWMERRSGWWVTVPAFMGGAWHLFALQILTRFNPALTVGVTGVGSGASAVLGIADPANVALGIALGIPLLLLPFAAPQRLVLAALPLLHFALAGKGGVGLLENARMALLLPGVFVAAIEGVKAMPRFVHATIGGAAGRRGFVVALLLGAAAYGMVTLGPVPSALQRLARPDTALIDAARAMTERIPRSEAVAAPPALLPALSGRYSITPIRADLASPRDLDVAAIPDETQLIILDARALRHADTDPIFTLVVP